ncbi:ABC transporter ATP-binding protein [Bacillus sp. MRMR6]|uniref:ABC transporter ATP-binding protein n=1 Tax=Bacillus sp. MRMR6 TaxID=1928617 RepID=UPI0009FB2A81|nr:ABC transporter ATP-binding protein [Bacillus sp. MRMR6]
MESEVKMMLKGILDKIFKPTQATNQSISQAEVEALVDAKIKEHAAALETMKTEQVNGVQEEDYTLTDKQIEYACFLIEKVKNEYELAIAPSELTIKDLNRLIAYNRYKNKGTLVNLVKKGVLKKK